MKTIHFAILILIISNGCGIYIEDIQDNYVERDDIYQYTKGSNDFFYSAVFRTYPRKIENISFANDFTLLPKDTIYNDYIARNYYNDIPKEYKNDSLKIKYSGNLKYCKNEKEYYKKNAGSGYIMLNSYYQNYIVYSNFNDYKEYHQYYNNQWNNNVYRPITFGKIIKIELNNYNNTTSNIKKNESRSNKTYEEYKQQNTKTSVPSSNEYEKRATNRRRR